MKNASLVLLFSLFVVTMNAQELNCQISINSQQVEGTDKRIFESLQRALYEFLNNRKWSNYNIKNEERLECTFLITVNERMGSDEFRGTLNVVLRRPVLNTAYNTTLLNHVDKEIVFRYVEYQPLDYSEGTFSSNLTSIFAYYAYTTLGFYFDSFSLNGGNPFFVKAQAIITSAQGAQEPGWKGFESTKNRVWLIENFTNPSNGALRDFMYKYHREGLDQMYDKLDQGRGSITESLEYLKTIFNAKPDLFALTIILDAKRDEFVNIYSDQKVPPMEKTSVANLLKEIDPANSSKYQAIIAK